MNKVIEESDNDDELNHSINLSRLAEGNQIPFFHVHFAKQSSMGWPVKSGMKEDANKWR